MAVLIVLLLCGLFVVGIVKVGARDQDLSVDRLATVQAFYAAEAGVNMAVREMMINTDEDGDGTIGTISDDASDATDPALNNGRVVVTRAGSPDIVITSVGRAGDTRRTIEATFQ